MSREVIGGSITVEDGIKGAQDYQPPRKVAVTLTFDVAKGSDACVVLERVGRMADTAVRAVLMGEPFPAPQAIEAAPEEPKRRGRPPRPVERASEAASAAGEGAAPSPSPEPSPEPAAEPITDIQLHEELVRRQGIEEIKALIRQHHPEGTARYSAATIPQEQRAAFLEALRKLPMKGS